VHAFSTTPLVLVFSCIIVTAPLSLDNVSYNGCAVLCFRFGSSTYGVSLCRRMPFAISFLASGSAISPLLCLLELKPHCCLLPFILHHPTCLAFAVAVAFSVLHGNFHHCRTLYRATLQNIPFSSITALFSAAPLLRTRLAWNAISRHCLLRFTAFACRASRTIASAVEHCRFALVYLHLCCCLSLCCLHTLLPVFCTHQTETQTQQLS